MEESSTTETGHLPDRQIVDFIRSHHVMTLATVSEEGPYCANVFYSWLEMENAFIFTSSLETRHGREADRHARVAGSIVLETRTVGKIRGMQLTGRMFRPQGDRLAQAKKRYLRRFPFAIVMDLELWLLEPDFIKLTDNRLGFGKKLIWKK